jgi:SAM-dependent methyltransferase
MSAPAYDRIGVDYSEVRRADPRIGAAIWTALGDAETVLNIGAGAGSYEPVDREVIAIEPSAVMIAQRPASAAPALQAFAESLPLPDKSVDATMGVFTMQHWSDVDRGLAEVLRVTRERVVFLTLDVDVMAKMWLVCDYLPALSDLARRDFPSIARLRGILPNPRIEKIPVPSDCTDGFCVGLWSRPEAHLDQRVRQASSSWHHLPETMVDRALTQLRQDLDSGEWDKRLGHLREMAELDVGLRLVWADLG